MVYCVFHGKSGKSIYKLMSWGYPHGIGNLQIPLGYSRGDHAMGTLQEVQSCRRGADGFFSRLFGTGDPEKLYSTPFNSSKCYVLIYIYKIIQYVDISMYVCIYIYKYVYIYVCIYNI
jgi:hypothetical protein